MLTGIEKAQQLDIEETLNFWLNEERRCVTVKSLTLEFDGLTRQEAVHLLEECVTRRHSSSTSEDEPYYEITRCVVDPISNGRSIVRLVTSTTANGRGDIYSVCPKDAKSSVQAAHEIDRVKERQIFFAAEGQQQQSRIPPPIIRPSSQLLVDNIASATNDRSSSGSADAKENTLPVLTSNKSTARQPERTIASNSSCSALPNTSATTHTTTTTAAKFFSSSNSKSNGVDHKRKNTVTEDLSSSPTPAAVLKANPPKPTAMTDHKKISNNTETGASGTTNTHSKLVGNADDFIGDESSSSEEEETITKANRKNKPKDDQGEQSTTKKKKPRRNHDSSSQVVDAVDSMVATQKEVTRSKESTKGAMDSFASTRKVENIANIASNAIPNATAKARRKKYIEQTTMDERGYMHTETVCIMEDIPEEEMHQSQQLPKEIPKSSNNKSTISTSTSNANNKKQMGLNAFFAAKKK